MRRQFFTIVGLILVGVAVIFVSVYDGGVAKAAQTATVGGSALKVSPVRLDVKLDPGVTQEVNLYVQNISNVKADLRAVVNDFVASGDESGRPNIILGESEFAPSRSLKRLVTPIKNFTVDPGENKEVSVTLKVPKNAAGGGYFGAIRFEPVDATDEENLNLSASVGSLILLRINGDIKEEATIESFDVRKKNVPSIFFTNSENLQAAVRVKNSGNVHIEPFGKVIVKRFGKKVGEYEINDSEQRGNVLPDSVRRFEVDLKSISSFGKYSLEGNFGYGSTGQLLAARTTVYVIPVFMLAVISGLILFILFCIFGLPKMIRAYNRRVIRRASRRR